MRFLQTEGVVVSSQPSSPLFELRQGFRHFEFIGSRTLAGVSQRQRNYLSLPNVFWNNLNLTITSAFCCGSWNPWTVSLRSTEEGGGREREEKLACKIMAACKLRELTKHIKTSPEGHNLWAFWVYFIFLPPSHQVAEKHFAQLNGSLSCFRVRILKRSRACEGLALGPRRYLWGRAESFPESWAPWPRPWCRSAGGSSLCDGSRENTQSCRSPMPAANNTHEETAT